MKEDKIIKTRRDYTISEKKYIDKQYLLNTLKDFDKEILSKKYTNATSPHIGDNGNWFIGDIDTNVPAKGQDGKPGNSVIVTEDPNNKEDYYRLNITNGENTFITPNLMGVIGMEYKNKSVGTPVGEIISYMGTIAPKNYLICDGSEYQIIDYPYLSQHFTDNFGNVNYFGGNGETTFAVPDLRGEFLRGTGINKYKNQGNGSEVGEHQDGTVHKYFGIVETGDREIRFPYYTHDIRNGETTLKDSNTNTMDYKKVISSVRTISWKHDKTADENDVVTYYSSRPTNTSVLYCIKYKPTYFICTNETYSYEERCIGTWVDGKKLYEKTIDFGPLPNAGIKSVPHGIENSKNIWIYDGYVFKESEKISVPTSLPHITKTIDNWYCFCDNVNVKVNTGIDRSDHNAVFVLRYTKTID